MSETLKQLLNLENYLDLNESDSRKADIYKLFEPYNLVIENINRSFGFNASHIPEIMVVDSVCASTRDWYGKSIIINAQLIDRCLKPDFSAFKEIISESVFDEDEDEAYEFPPEIRFDSLLPLVVVMWTYSQQYFHFIQKYQELTDQLREIEGENFDFALTVYALDMNADEHAAELIYRYLQKELKKKIPDIILRKIIIYIIFWSLRHYCTDETNEDHLSSSIRLQNAVNAISMFSKSQVEKKILKVTTVGVRTGFAEIAYCLASCEERFVEHYEALNKGQKTNSIFGGRDSSMRMSLIERIYARLYTIKAVANKIS